MTLSLDATSCGRYNGIIALKTSAEIPALPISLFFLALVGSGAIAGLLTGFFGLGGGIIIVLLLDTLFKLYGMAGDAAMHMAVGTAQLTVAASAIASLRIHAKREAVDTGLLRQWAVALIGGALLGGLAANYVAGHWLSGFFGLVLLLIGGFIAFAPDGIYLREQLPQGLYQKAMVFSIGLVTAMLGIGGGSLAVPTLVLCNMPIHRAIGTSAAISLMIALPAALISMLALVAAGDFNAASGAVPAPPGSFGNVNLLVFAVLAPVMMVTSKLGARLTHRFSGKKLQRAFGLLLCVLALKMLLI